MGAKPSSSNKHRWSLNVGVTNLSHHPTEVEIEYYLVGIAQETRGHFIMMKGAEKVKLREIEDWQGHYWSDSKKDIEGVARIANTPAGEKVKTKRKKKDGEGKEEEVDPLYKDRERTDSDEKFIYRGWIVRVMYDGERIGYATSSKDLFSHIKWGSEELYGIPAYTGPDY